MAKKKHYSSGKEGRYNMTSRPVPNSMNRYGVDSAHASGMIDDDHSAPCNLPTHVIDKYWAPRAYALHQGVPNDLYRGAEKQLHQDVVDFRREFEPKKY